MSKPSVNPLSAEFLYELYAMALRCDSLCGILVQHMHSEYLPDRSFQKVQEVLANHYTTYKAPPTYAVLTQTLGTDYDAVELLNTFREYDQGQNTEALVDLLEAYIKGVKLQSVYAEVGKLYNQSRQQKAEEVLRSYAEWLAGFTLKSSSFVDVAGTFAERYELKLVCAFGLPAEEVRLEPLSASPDGSIKYWRDDAGVHHVPKRSLEDVLI